MARARGERIIAEIWEIPSGAQDPFREWLSRAWYETVGSGGIRHYAAGTRAEQIRERNGVRFYVSKYIAKEDEEASAASPHRAGRWWGVKGRGNIPWGERVVFECTRKEAVTLMRWGRRYVRSVTGRDYRFSRFSMSVFVNDADRWLRLLGSLLDDG